MGSPLPISIVATELRLTDLRTRLPFRFGGAILSAAPLATLRVLVKTEDGEDAEGFSSDLLVPKWFEKDPAKSARDDVISLLASIERATASWTRAAAAPTSVFAAWQGAYAECVGAFEQGVLFTGAFIALDGVEFHKAATT